MRRVAYGGALARVLAQQGRSAGDASRRPAASPRASVIRCMLPPLLPARECRPAGRPGTRGSGACCGQADVVGRGRSFPRPAARLSRCRAQRTSARLPPPPPPPPARQAEKARRPLPRRVADSYYSPGSRCAAVYHALAHASTLAQECARGMLVASRTHRQLPAWRIPRRRRPLRRAPRPRGSRAPLRRRHPQPGRRRRSPPRRRRRRGRPLRPRPPRRGSGPQRRLELSRGRPPPGPLARHLRRPQALGPPRRLRRARPSRHAAGASQVPRAAVCVVAISWRCVPSSTPRA